MKTLQPLILTARIAESDKAPFDLLRKTHFPPDRNFLGAHLTMFHRLPGEYTDRIVEHLKRVAEAGSSIKAEVSGVRHLGAGVAFTIDSAALQDVRARLKEVFLPWLGPQDMQKWQPHITIQNKVSKDRADRLYQELRAEFQPYTIEITGVDLWKYLDGPWQHETSAIFAEDRDAVVSGRDQRERARVQSHIKE
ncbi:MULTISPECIES: 2'-5' RNA ligase family protein [unclassified Rhizobium]|uniref:2'-5' RNA ligase family protein n=1 Tax=unclassified Rhizobium TaxID=2613769 RepID=UPI001AE21F55|nr:2'-5' RNA ligase [Rhizobium sp. PvP014]MBP2529380.1 2'-5' RNA ligase [Rhizobium sp. PvP099]